MPAPAWTTKARRPARVCVREDSLTTRPHRPRKPDASTNHPKGLKSSFRRGRPPAPRRSRQQYSAQASRLQSAEVQTVSCALLSQIQFQFRESLPHPGQNPARFVNLSQPFFRDPKVSLGFSTTLRGWIAQVGDDQPLGLQTLQRCINTAYRNTPATIPFQFTRDGHAVGLFA